MDAHPVLEEVVSADDDETSPPKDRRRRRGRDPNTRRAKNILAKNTRREDLLDLERDRIDLAEFMASREYREFLAARPTRRSQCRGMPRPCMYIACEHHLYLDVDPRTGTIKINFPGRDLDQLEETCDLDVAERGGESLERVGSLMNVTRERARQIETKGFRAMRERLPSDIDDDE